MYALDPLTTLKARMNNAGKASALVQHEWRPKSFFTVSGEVDTKAIRRLQRKGPKFEGIHCVAQTTNLVLYLKGTEPFVLVFCSFISISFLILTILGLLRFDLTQYRTLNDMIYAQDTFQTCMGDNVPFNSFHMSSIIYTGITRHNFLFGKFWDLLVVVKNVSTESCFEILYLCIYIKSEFVCSSSHHKHERWFCVKQGVIMVNFQLLSVKFKLEKSQQTMTTFEMWLHACNSVWLCSRIQHVAISLHISSVVCTLYPSFYVFFPGVYCFYLHWVHLVYFSHLLQFKLKFSLC
ncbi:mitochondrial outer membrane protein porin of [Salix suchowensis]|nr:mitochondrial outer membrane protein porin of [Salix suchowensis]